MLHFSKVTWRSWHVVLFAAGLIASASAENFFDQGLWDAGAQTQGFADNQPGDDYLMGLDAGYSNFNLYRHQLELRFAYLTNRPIAYAAGQKFSSTFPFWTRRGDADFRGGLREDWFLLSPTWHFRRRNIFDPTVEINGGFQDYENEDTRDFGQLQNTTWVFGARAGLCLNFAEGRYSLRYTFGYQAATSPSSVVYPLPFALGLTVLFY